MVISVAEFSENGKIKGVVRMSDEVRFKTLDVCYKMEGYKDLPLAEKNKVYDAVRKLVEEGKV